MSGSVRGGVRSPRAALRAALESGVVPAIGCYDALGARIAEQLGAPAVYVSGISLAAAFGVPDIGLMTQTEVLEASRRVARAVSVPVIVDVDTAFGGVQNVKRTVELFEEAGIAGVQIEDQTSPKRSGESKGKTLVPLEEMQVTVAAAKAAQTDPDFLLIARTDAISVNGYDDALARCLGYEEAGADALFPSLPQTLDHIKGFGAALKAYVMITSSESTITPLMTRDEYYAHGINLVVYPMSLVFAAGSAMTAITREILETGSNEAFLRRTDWSFEVLEGYTKLAEWRDFEDDARSKFPSP
jgi:2-methylisocitrate lyase-like PEP mutase family enzyme